MKTIKECLSWIEMMKGYKPNPEDLNFFNSIEKHLEEKQTTIEELEKVLEHIKKIRDLQPCGGDFCNGVKVGNTNDLIIVETHISRLKGENK